MNRNIWIFGNPDKSELGFPSPGDIVSYIDGDVFKAEGGRYRYTLTRNADVVILTRDGAAYGHFEIAGREKPNLDDKKQYPRVKCVYLVTASTPYANPVRLSNLGVTNIHWGKRITETEFARVLSLARPSLRRVGSGVVPGSTLEQERVLREIRLRLGQSEFRKQLLKAYRGKCVITSCDAPDALEAAHIDPYSGPGSNRVSNGLLLRADVHILFDLDLLGIQPATQTVAVGRQLIRTAYAGLNGKRIRAPSGATNMPNRHALERRWKLFCRGACDGVARAFSKQ